MPVDTAEIAARLAKARADRTPIEPFSGELADFDLAGPSASSADVLAATTAVAVGSEMLDSWY